MTGEDIIEALNRNIESRRRENKINTVGHLVLLRTIKMNSTFKAYKTYEAIVYFVSKKKKYRVLSCTLTAKVLDGQEERMKTDVDIKFCFCKHILIFTYHIYIFSFISVL